MTRGRSKGVNAGARAASPLSSVIDRQALRRMAGGRSFERGEGYFADGRVRNLAQDRGKIAAEVRGTHTYRVTLWAEDGELEFSCTCPLGQDGVFCKHCVAVGLAWLDPAGGATKAAPKREKPSVTMDDSDGTMGGILEQLQALHLKACKQAKPDPEALAKRLFAWELRTPWDTFYGAAETYAGWRR